MERGRLKAAFVEKVVNQVNTMQGLIDDFSTHMEVLLGVRPRPVALEENECVRLEVPLNADGQQIDTYILFDPSSQLLFWRAPLLKKRSEQQLFHFGVLKGEPGYLELSQAAELGRLRTTDEEGPVFEIALPFIETLSENTVRILLVEMGWAFTLQRACMWAADGGDMELSPADCEPEIPDMASKEEPSPKTVRSVAKGRVAEIDRAIKEGDIALARRLSRGGDIDIPDAV
ncbi:hypothetical protein G3480_22460 [Thiorhodococcus mannitoliphagus]|uniref:Uncharacterized protein n=1 Tax=Thiorhodococcus mannitoliphagus TaxID=329406 RepID=A0A6P1DXH8_9GAMM|nr:hypothetical protein [Thiorhodococcus mannitoliphagus]NEX23027.1 hypothetical protein [Thiorhodococcus mannitoliphagus]